MLWHDVSVSQIGIIEYHHCMKTGDQAMDLSEQEIVDCSDSNGNLGCVGGWFYSAWDYVIEKGGIARELTYPYLGEASIFVKIQHMYTYIL